MPAKRRRTQLQRIQRIRLQRIRQRQRVGKGIPRPLGRVALLNPLAGAASPGGMSCANTRALVEA